MRCGDERNHRDLTIAARHQAREVSESICGGRGRHVANSVVLFLVSGLLWQGRRRRRAWHRSKSSMTRGPPPSTKATPARSRRCMQRTLMCRRLAMTWSRVAPRSRRFGRGRQVNSAMPSSSRLTSHHSAAAQPARSGLFVRDQGPVAAAGGRQIRRCLAQSWWSVAARDRHLEYEQISWS